MRLLISSLAWLLLTLAAFAQDHPLRGVALVVGESDYAALTPLTNPDNDARAMDDLLDQLGFEVSRVLDADRAKLTERFARFVEDAKDADVALVYYSGHGIEAGGENYLVPIDADIATPESAGASLVPLSSLLDELAKAVPVTIVLLDACRTNAFPPGQLIQLPQSDAVLAVAETGLGEARGPTPVARTDVPADNLGMVIGFAASPGQAALDGASGENSPYAAALIKHLSAGGYSFGDVMTMVGEEVYLKTKTRQLPWVNSSLRRVLNFGAVPAGDADALAIREGRRQLLLSIAGAPPATRQYVEAVANAEGVPLDALYGMLKVLGVDTSGGATDIEQQLLEGAKQLKALKEQAPGGVKSDAELVRLSALAATAEEEGAIELALKFREQATERARVLSSERDQLEASLAADRMEIGETFAEHGQTASLNFDFKTAAEMYGEAFGEVERWDAALALQYKWAEAGALRSHGDFKADNDALARAIAAYEAALRLAPQETNPSDWLSIENDLGWALYALGSRETDTAHLARAVDVLQAALDAGRGKEGRFDRAVTQMNLANTLTELGQRNGDPAQLERAVAIYGEALAGATRDADPYSWGKIQLNLAGTLRILGDRDSGTERLEQSVASYEAALTEIRRDLSPLDWGLAQNNYGTTLFSLGTRLHDVTLLEKSAAAFRAALEERTEDVVPLDWAMSQTNLANVLVTVAGETGDIGALNEGIASYRASFRQLTREKVPLLWATAQSNLGVALNTLANATSDPYALEESIAAFRASLEVRTREIDPINWAMTQFNLAGALQGLGVQVEGTEMLSEAVAAAEAALTEWTRERVPLNWAKAKYNLGYALASRGDREEGTDSYKLAVAAFTDALGEFSREATPVEWVAAEENLAFTLQSLGDREEGAESLRAAVDAYRAALLVDTLAADPAEYGRMNFNLGLTLQSLHWKGEAGALDASIAAFRAALDGYPRETAPEDWADTQYNLAYVLHTEASTTQDVAPTQAAVAAYRAALEVITPEADLEKWATVENYYGTVLGLLGQITEDPNVVQEGRDAIAAAWDGFKALGYDYDEDFAGRLAQFDALLEELA